MDSRDRFSASVLRSSDCARKDSFVRSIDRVRLANVFFNVGGGMEEDDPPEAVAEAEAAAEAEVEAFKEAEVEA